MDFLSNLNLHELPEQQTKINEKISFALEDNPDLRLGFDACCTCAKKLKLSDKADTCCKSCKRVWYCSKTCRRLDADVPTSDDERSQGHSSIMCALLRLCGIDDYVEDPHSADKVSVTKEEREASKIRITSEYESYPATLANILMDAACFEPTLHRFKKQRRTKTIRQSDLETTHQEPNKTLTIHVIGASEEAELWGKFTMKHECSDVHSAYSDALTEMASTYPSIATIRLIFIGPNCPSKNLHEIRIKGVNNDQEDPKLVKKRKHEGKTFEVIIESHRNNYDKKTVAKIPVPDFVVFFNPGFTCQDYNWAEALEACRNRNASRRVPFLITTNTEMEAISDLQYLHQNGFIDELPAMVADIVDGASEHDTDIADYNDNNIFFGENPNAGMRIRQSGNMANDLFVKNRWIYGGLFVNVDADVKATGNKSKSTTHVVQKKNKKNTALM